MLSSTGRRFHAQPLGVERVLQLDEQEAGGVRIGQYVRRWCTRLQLVICFLWHTNESQKSGYNVAAI